MKDFHLEQIHLVIGSDGIKHPTGDTSLGRMQGGIFEPALAVALLRDHQSLTEMIRANSQTKTKVS